MFAVSGVDVLYNHLVTAVVHGDSRGDGVPGITFFQHESGDYGGQQNRCRHQQDDADDR